MVEVGFTVVEATSVEVEKVPGVIATELAFVMFQESVLVPAAATTPGEAVNDVIEGRTPDKVVPDAFVDEAETLPTLSWAVTSYQYVVLVASPVLVYERFVVDAMKVLIEVDAAPR